MLAAVLPAKDEAGRINAVLRHLLRLPVGLVIPVLNGCQDMTLSAVRGCRDSRIKPLVYKEALGFDVPRIAGARAALKGGATHVLLIDADLAGPLQGPLSLLVERLRQADGDLLLCDCYAATPVPRRQSRASQVYQARTGLNRALGREDLGAAISSHGPSVVSRRLLEQMPESFLGVPPLVQAYAVREGFRVLIGTAVPHRQLGSAVRDRAHAIAIAETILGDCHTARCYAEGMPLSRGGHDGYHSARRFDLLGLQPPAEPGLAEPEQQEPEPLEPEVCELEEIEPGH